jgi:RNase adapter protein RapZ
MSRIVLVTGMAGAGRTTALKALEDMGFEAVDNLPLTLLDSMVRSGERLDQPLAIGIDCRSRAFDPVGLQRLLETTPRPHEVELRLLFLDCDDEILRRRFTETRRRHPLAGDRPVTDGIGRERHLIAPLREHADLVIDTSQLTPGDLRRLLGGHFHAAGGDRLTLSVLSFAYRYGLPREADLVFDVRFLVNPHYVEALRPRTGLDPEVRRYVEADASYALLLDRLDNLLQPLLPCFKREGKSYLTIAFGCTGGRHRSIVVAESFAARLRAAGWSVVIHHRDTPEANPSLGAEAAMARIGALA